MADKKATKESVLKALNEAAGRKDYFEVREVETADGMATQIISGGGSLVLQANGTGDEVWKKLEGQTTGVVDKGSNPTESAENNKKFFSKTGAVAFPTQPEAIEGTSEVNEVNPKADRGDENAAGNSANATPKVSGANAKAVESTVRGGTNDTSSGTKSGSLNSTSTSSTNDKG